MPGSKSFMLTLMFTVSVLFLASCVNQTAKLERDFKGVKTEQSTFRGQLADHTGDLIEIKDTLRRIRGRLEELEYQQRTQVGSELSGLKRELSSLQQRVPPPAIVPVEALEADEKKAAKMRGTAGVYLSQVLKYLREGEFRQALVSVQKGLSESMIVNSPGALKDSRSGNTGSGLEFLFWRAVCFDALNENARAIEGYDEVVRRFPKQKRSALALLRTASVLNRIGDRNTSRITLKKLIGDFPDTLEAKVAKERLGGYR